MTTVLKMSWLWGSTTYERNKTSDKDRPPLAKYLQEIQAYEASSLSLFDEIPVCSSSDSSFHVVPLESIGWCIETTHDLRSQIQKQSHFLFSSGKRIEHNNVMASGLLSFLEVDLPSSLSCSKLSHSSKLVTLTKSHFI